MLDAERFVTGLVERGFTHLCVVPCSFASHLINAVINDHDIVYLPAASEAVAISVAAGIKMSGGRPLVVVQSSGMTNLGSCMTSLLKPYDIRVPIITSWRKYREGDSEIQHQQLATALPDLIAAYGYSCSVLSAASEQLSLDQVEQADVQGEVLLLEEGTFAKHQLASRHALDLSIYPPRTDYLSRLPGLVPPETVFVGTTGNTSREMYHCMHSSSNFYMAGNMGGALSVGLGAALQGRHVVVCGGDAEFVMHLGGLATAGRYRNQLGSGSLLYLVFDNASNKSTGGQRSYQEHLDYIAIARGCNLAAHKKIISGLAGFDQGIKELAAKASPSLLHVLCSYDPVAPRPTREAILNSVDSMRGEPN